MNEYDTPEGIATYLTDLASLNLLASLRRIARQNGELLHNYCVLGRWSFDQFAQVCPLGDRNHKAPADLGTCPPVMTEEQLQLFMRNDTLVRVFDWPFPPEYAACTSCGEKWTISNAHDFMHQEESEEVPIEAFVGQLFSSVTEIPSLVGVTKHFVDHEIIYNEHHPEGEKLHKARNGNQWRYVTKDYVVQPGDRASVRQMSFSHVACNQKAAELRTRAEFEEAFRLAGYPKVNLITKPNQYCPCTHCTPWYSAQVPGSPAFTLGWRKSVINVSWAETGRSLTELFDGEAVTRGSDHIHAHGYAKLTQYLSKLLPALGAVRDA